MKIKFPGRRSTNIEDRRGLPAPRGSRMGGGLPIPIGAGGGIGTIIILIIVAVLGGAASSAAAMAAGSASTPA